MWFGQTGLNINRFETGLCASVNGAYGIRSLRATCVDKLPASFTVFPVLSLWVCPCTIKVSLQPLYPWRCSCEEKNTRLSLPAQLQCLLSIVWEPGNECHSPIDSTTLLLPWQSPQEMENGGSLGNKDNGLPSLLSLALTCETSGLFSIWLLHTQQSQVSKPQMLPSTLTSTTLSSQIG